MSTLVPDKPERLIFDPATETWIEDTVSARLWDLVRFQRSDLLTAGLIDEDEYALLAQDHPAVARLETYDQMRLRLKQIKDLAEAGVKTPQDAVGTLKKVLSLLP